MDSPPVPARDTLHAWARRCFWALPAPLRERLHGVRHTLVRWLRAGAARRRMSAGADAGALDWPAFRDTVLAAHAGGPVAVFEASLDWGVRLRQRPHHLAAALGRRGWLVVYRTLGDGVAGFQAAAPGVWLANSPAVDGIAGLRCFSSTSLLATAAELQAAARRGPVVYDYVDHIDASISGGRTELQRLHALQQAAFGEAAVRVVASAAALFREACQACGPARCAYVPNGVDVAHYRDPRQLQAAVPPALQAARAGHRAIVGFFGAIAPWLWYEAMDAVAARMADVAFVFIGPDYGGCVPRLPQRANVVHLGAVDYAALPGYARVFDVCWIPFRPGPVARATSPLKLFEYFALEKPVVVTADMRECTAYPEVFAGDGAAALASAIDAALAAGRDATHRQRLRALADANDWSVRAQAWQDFLR